VDISNERLINILVRARRFEIKKILESHSDPVQLEAFKSAPLTTQQAVQQLELRRAFTQFQKKLAEAEEAISMLRARLTAHEVGKDSGQPAPTADAIIKTINKMTSMAEKKSGDVDVLELQLRKLRLGSPARNSRANSPFATPPPPASQSMLRSLLGQRGSSPGSTGSKQAFFTPESPSMRRSRLGKTTPAGSTPGSTRGLLGGLTEDDVTFVRDRARRKRLVGEKLKAAVEARGHRERTIV
jgi:nucleoporin NUP159